jgi:hypothetical protein
MENFFRQVRYLFKPAEVLSTSLPQGQRCKYLFSQGLLFFPRKSCKKFTFDIYM